MSNLVQDHTKSNNPIETQSYPNSNSLDPQQKDSLHNPIKVILALGAIKSNLDLRNNNIDRIYQFHKKDILIYQRKILFQVQAPTKSRRIHPLRNTNSQLLVHNKSAFNPPLRRKNIPLKMNQQLTDTSDRNSRRDSRI